MGISVEFNPDLALRSPETPGRLEEECVPKELISGKVYRFLKKGQRNYWISGEIPLLITKGDEKLSRPIASIKILEATHFIRRGEIYTRGLYTVNEVYDFNDKTIHFEGYKKI